MLGRLVFTLFGKGPQLTAVPLLEALPVQLPMVQLPFLFFFFPAFAEVLSVACRIFCAVYLLLQHGVCRHDRCLKLY